MLMLAMTCTTVSGGGGEDGAEIADPVATVWVQDNIDTVSEVLIGLLSVAAAWRDIPDRIPDAKTWLTRIVEG